MEYSTKYATLTLLERGFRETRLRNYNIDLKFKLFICFFCHI